MHDTNRRSQISSNKLHAGIDAGTVSLNCVLVNEAGDLVYEHPFICHFGRVEEKVLELMRNIYDKFGEENIGSVSFTGSHGKKLSEKFGVYFEFETISLVTGAVRLCFRSFIRMGTGSWNILKRTVPAPQAPGLLSISRLYGWQHRCTQEISKFHKNSWTI